MRAAGSFLLVVLGGAASCFAAEPSHWAFQKPVRPPVPEVKHTGWVRNPLDAFIAARHAEEGLKPAPEADRPVLLRRVFLDLTGLPPTRDQLHAFVNDASPDAYERLVDRLLASPQYGERWGRHWMDVWRYSDWYGRRAVKDVRNSYPHVWRWRDWIVRSLNADKGYDRMIREMLAADEIAPADEKTVVATGYIARNWFSLNYDQWMKDLVEHTGKAFLGLRFNCAHCHDHKYDPITNKDYFRFRAFFEPLEMRHDRVPGGPAVGRLIPYSEGGPNPRKPIEAGLVRVFDKKLDAKTWMYRGGDARNRIEDQPPVKPGVPEFLGGDELAIEPVDLPPTAWYPGLQDFVQQAELRRRQRAVREAQAVLEKSEKKLAALNAESGGDDKSQHQLEAARLKAQVAEAKHAKAEADLQAIQARIAADEARFQDASGDPEDLARAASRAERELALRTAELKQAKAEQALAAARQKAGEGEKENQKAKQTVQKAKKQLAAAEKAVKKARQALDEESTEYTPLSPRYPKRSSGRRAALARWIADEDNPLTARVAVNHIWMRHFGRPLVESVFDFGKSGKRPTHPKLLDWLAVEFMDSGWSMKHLHRLIVTSSTYRMSSKSGGMDNPNLAADPDNRNWWRFEPRRAEAEVIRDSLLHSAGQLNFEMGGPVIPNAQAAQITRRSLYFTIHPEAGGVMAFVQQFDPPDPCDCYRRSESIMPQQALAMTNSRLARSQGRLLARRLWGEVTNNQDDAKRNRAFIVAAFEQVLSRPPSAKEVTVSRTFLEKQKTLFRETGAKKLEAPSKEGLVPPSTEPAMRARESLVRSLFSHNEFVSIR